MDNYGVMDLRAGARFNIGKKTKIW
jgi:hypothetical protein